jgi:ribosome-associated protein
MIAGGEVRVDGHDETRKTCKIRAGQIVGVAETQVSVQAPGRKHSDDITET